MHADAMGRLQREPLQTADDTPQEGSRRREGILVPLGEKSADDSPAEIANLAVGSTEGFSFVLAGAKALLEHGVLLNLVPDRFPDGLPKA